MNCYCEGTKSPKQFINLKGNALYSVILTLSTAKGKNPRMAKTLKFKVDSSPFLQKTQNDEIARHCERCERKAWQSIVCRLLVFAILKKA